MGSSAANCAIQMTHTCRFLGVPCFAGRGCHTFDGSGTSTRYFLERAGAPRSAHGQREVSTGMAHDKYIVAWCKSLHCCLLSATLHSLNRHHGAFGSRLVACLVAMQLHVANSMCPPHDILHSWLTGRSPCHSGFPKAIVHTSILVSCLSLLARSLHSA